MSLEGGSTAPQAAAGLPPCNTYSMGRSCPPLPRAPVVVCTSPPGLTPTIVVPGAGSTPLHHFLRLPSPPPHYRPQPWRLLSSHSFFPSTGLSPSVTPRPVAPRPPAGCPPFFPAVLSCLLPRRAFVFPSPPCCLASFPVLAPFLPSREPQVSCSWRAAKPWPRHPTSLPAVSLLRLSSPQVRRRSAQAAHGLATRPPPLALPSLRLSSPQV